MQKVGFFRSIQLKFIIIFILLLLVAIQVIGSYFGSELESELFDNFKQQINQRVDLLELNLEEAFNKERTDGSNGMTLQEEVQNIVSSNKGAPITKLQVIDKQSRVMATSDYSNLNIVGKKTTNELINQVVRFGIAQDTRQYNVDTGNRVYRKAIPIYDDEQTQVGTIFLEASLKNVYDQLQQINRIFVQGSILAITVSAFMGILVARTITKPIMEMRRQAQTMARGDFSQKVNVYGTDEIGQLAETFNDLNVRLKHSRALTEEERRKLSSVLSNMSDGVIATDKSGAVSLMNDAAAKLLSVDPEEAQGAYLMDLLQLDEKTIDISDLPDTGSIIIDFSEEDSIFLIRANFSTISDEEDDITGFITVISDVTEQEKVEQERREFVSNVSHELRTPLTTMRSYIEALSEGAWEDKEIAPRFLGVAQNETDRMIRMVNDLLQLSKMDSKELPLQREKVEFIELYHHVIDRFEMNVEEGIHLVRDLPNGKYYVWMDKDKMIQVMDNIITNAIKYSPEGGTIRFGATKQKSQLLISIEDEGMGISYDKVDKIFERFYRADKARTRKLGGTGLGLAISKELVEAHHGRIWAKSKEGKGTTILFTLPLMNKKRRGKK
ncbi:cell wall metabolism sensor histidine kinase WalK [Virgibacillus ihumii]|uniref:cell wall metabolism sensor histidine kinase WalK n=1 Tax=Virgibacillus ihumii TaxID=2686091 RepID=UPI00157DEA01|nr:cell wall metabolism sensor histidine kinase WalK [Virgibacillus ihumii]